MDKNQKIITLCRNNKNIRIRKETKGCIIFDSNGTMATSDDTTFEILLLIINNKSFNEVAKNLSKDYGVPYKTILGDIKDLSIMLDKMFGVALE